VLHACAQNPSGVDPTQEQWEAVAALLLEKGAIPFFDCAYQGYATGDLDRDAASVRTFERMGLEMLISQSYSKNFGLYGERVGALTVTSNAGPDVAKAVLSQLKICTRTIISSPPAYGARIVHTVLSDPELYAMWVKELRTMSDRIVLMRSEMRKGLETLGAPGSFEYITTQIGMFAYTGMTKTQVARMVGEFHIYMTSNGRVSMAGVSLKTLPYFCASMKDVLENTE